MKFSTRIPLCWCRASKILCRVSTSWVRTLREREKICAKSVFLALLHLGRLSHSYVHEPSIQEDTEDHGCRSYPTADYPPILRNEEHSSAKNQVHRQASRMTENKHLILLRTTCITLLPLSNCYTLIFFFS